MKAASRSPPCLLVPLTLVGAAACPWHKTGMQVLVHLPNPVRAFRMSAEQVARLGERFAGHDFVFCETTTELTARLPHAGAALVWHFEAAWYDLGPELRFVATPAAGRERVATDPRGRVRTLHGAFHGKIMAETLLGMLLFWSRRFDRAVRDRAEHRYERDPFSSTRRLAGQTALVVGFGPLGRHCATLLKAIGMRVVGVKRHPSGDPSPADAVHSAAALPEQLPEADHVIATLPSDTGTDHLFDAQAFGRMRPSAYFYNLGRGNAVDEAALVRALERGALAGAFLDVFEREPLPLDSPLWTAKNLEFMPHASAICEEYLSLWLDELAPEFEAQNLPMAPRP